MTGYFPHGFCFAFAAFFAVNSVCRLRIVQPKIVTTPNFIQVQPDGILLSVKVQPRASTNEIGQPLGNELRIRVTAPPVDSAANEALVRLLAEKLRCPRSKVELVRGATLRHKIVKLHGLSVEAVAARLSGDFTE